MVTDEEFIAHFEKIRPQIEGDGSELKGFLTSWCPAYMQDAQETAEGLMLEFSMDVADQYLYSLTTCIRSTYVENSSEFPQLTDLTYEEVSLNLLRVRSEESEYTLEYFEQLEREYLTRFPVTARTMKQIALHQINRLHISRDEYDYGFYAGAEHAMSILAEVMRR